MKKKVFLSLMAVVPLIVLSCSKSIVEPEAVSTQTQKLSRPGEFTPREMVFAGNGNLTINADYSAETKSVLSMNGAGTFASVLWTGSESFRMVDQGLSYTTYTTSETGEKVSFTGGTTLGSGPYLCFYPASSLLTATEYNYKIIYLVDTPTDQVATPGSVQDGVNLSFAQIDTQDEDIHFQNMLAVLKFRLAGDVVSSVKKVTFGGTSNMTGQTFMAPTDAGEPEFVDLWYESNPPKTYVTLSGDFVAGVDYYVTVMPGVQDSFYMSFENGDGTKSIKKFSSKVITLNRSRITDFGTINLGDDFDPSNNPILYIEHTTADPDYATIAVIPDGYTAEEMDQYVVDAQSGIDALFNTEPYKSYKGYFNVWILKVASKDSGARISDSGNPDEKYRDCYFQSSWGASSYDNMKANADRVFSFVMDNCPDIVNGTHIIEDVPVLLVINDTRYGGVAWNYDNGMTYCMVPKSYDGSNIEWSYPGTEANGVDAVPENTRVVTDGEKTAMGKNVGTWRNTLVHEFGGHSIGKLGDEYWYDKWYSPVDEIAQHSWAVPMKLNVSAKSNPSLVPWNEFFESAIEEKMAGISPKYAERIGVFQGADVSMFYRWRSERISCMIDNRFYFSTWQRYIIVNRIMTLAGLGSMSVSDFLDNDDPTDPVRDGGSPVMNADGISKLPAIEVPMLPPPVYAHWED